jgi:hypothetical protein
MASGRAHANKKKGRSVTIGHHLIFPLTPLPAQLAGGAKNYPKRGESKPIAGSVAHFGD